MSREPIDPHRPIPVTVVHPLLVRVTHWINAGAMLVMIGSGWAIYDVSPLLPFTFPHWLTIGGWLGGALAWHFAAMWVLVTNGLVYAAYGLLARHFRQSFLPIGPRLVWQDLRAALALRIEHRLGVYNAVQRLAYLGVLALGILIVLTGLSIWKPVQLAPLTDFFGGYEVARRLHFTAMTGIVAFVTIHLAMVAVVPETLRAMITGRAKVHVSLEEVKP